LKSSRRDQSCHKVIVGVPEEAEVEEIQASCCKVISRVPEEIQAAMGVFQGL
jgi:hypothetical protein